MKNFVNEYKMRRKQYLAKHKKTEIAAEYAQSLIAMLFCAFISALTFKIFLSPDESIGALPLISGGASGVSKSISIIFDIATNRGVDQTLVYSIAYTLVNIPLFYLAFRYIGFRFAIFTVINVVATSLMTNFFNFSFINPLAKNIACVIKLDDGSLIQAGLLARTIIAGISSGVTSALAITAGGSAGGSDTVSYYFSMRKSSNVGRYMIIINSIIFTIFVFLNAVSEKVIDNFPMETVIANALLILLFELIFSFVTSLVIDMIARHNKKDQVQIITKVENLSKLLLANIPHGATIVRSKGAFTGEDHIIIYVIVSTYETKEVIKLVRDADPNSFINVTSVKQVYGRFAKPKVK
ncbi:MAG: YitT family protein [Bacilli bacterium]|nr:YitT family protein [Bacilli bacterium]